MDHEVDDKSVYHEAGCGTMVDQFILASVSLLWVLTCSMLHAYCSKEEISLSIPIIDGEVGKAMQPRTGISAMSILR